MWRPARWCEHSKESDQRGNHLQPRWLAAGRTDGRATLNVWDAETGKVVRTIDTKEDIIRDAAFRPDGARLAVVGDSGRATIWSVPGWEPVQSLRVSEQHATAAIQ